MKFATKARAKIPFVTSPSGNADNAEGSKRSARGNSDACPWQTFWLFVGVFLLIIFLIGALSEQIRSSEPLSLRPEVGTRGLGLSGAFISSADDATGALWNPAGLATLQAGDFIYDVSQGAFSLAYPISPLGTFGVNLLDFHVGGADRFLVNHPNNPVGTFEYGSNQAMLSYARAFGALQLGANLGYTRAPYINSQWAPSYDGGALLTLNPNITLGMRVRDISGVVIYGQNGQVLQTFAPQFAFGATVRLHSALQWHSRIDATSRSLGTGLELSAKNISVRMGIASAFDDLNELRYAAGVPLVWSLGLSYYPLGKQLHYTYLNRGDVEHKHLLSVGFTFGHREEESAVQDTPSSRPQHSPKNRLASGTQSTARHTPSPKRGNSQATSSKNVEQIAKQHGIELELLLALVHVESTFNPLAVSPSGAGGLMQMMPPTARELGLKVPQYKNRRNPTRDGKVDERFDARKNLHAGLNYLKMLLDKYDGNRQLALGAYNVGPGRVKKGGPLPAAGKKYAGKVLSQYKLYRGDKSLRDAAIRKLEGTL